MVIFFIIFIKNLSWCFITSLFVLATIFFSFLKSHHISKNSQKRVKIEYQISEIFRYTLKTMEIGQIIVIWHNYWKWLQILLKNEVNIFFVAYGTCRVWDVHKVYEDLEGIIMYKYFCILHGLHLQVRGIKNIYLTKQKTKLNVSYTAL